MRDRNGARQVGSEMSKLILAPPCDAGVKISPHLYPTPPPLGAGNTHVVRSREGWVKRDGAKVSSLNNNL